MDWWNLMKQSVTVGAQLLWSSRYGCNNGRYGCTIVMSYIEINKAVSQWLLTFNLCVSVTWPLTCAFHIPCMHTPEIIDMHRGMCDKTYCTHLRVPVTFGYNTSYIRMGSIEAPTFLVTIDQLHCTAGTASNIGIHVVLRVHGPCMYFRYTAW